MSMRSEIDLLLPATSANLGAAFDTAALALQLHLRVRAVPAEEFRITARGRDADICGRADRNLVVETYRDVLAANGREVLPLAIEVENDIPVGKGLGSSAAARLAGVAMASHFGDLPRSDEFIMHEAARRERHGDNVAACWLGGLAVVHAGDGSGAAYDLGAIKLETRAEWPLLVAVTEQALSTEQSRAALPLRYSRADAVVNLHSSMLLSAAFVSGRVELVRHALDDRIHQPYRSAMCPLLEPLRSLAGQEGVVGAVLSGAGPSVLIVVDPEYSPVAVQRRLELFLRERGLKAELLLTGIEHRGARDSQRACVAASERS